MPQPEIRLREPTRDDAASIAAAVNEHSRALFGEADLHAGEVLEWFELPDIWMRVVERDGRIVGYLDVVKDRTRPRWSIDARTLHADAYAAFVAAAEAYARSRAAVGDVLRGYAPDCDEPATVAYSGAGYRVIRHSFQMRIDLPDEIEPPEWPDGIAVRHYRPDDEERMYEATMESFADHWDFERTPIGEWRRYGVERDSFDPTLWWLAEDGGEVAGVSQNWWHFSGDRTFGWIGTLGVRKPWRRRGLARALLLHSFADFKRRGATRVGLGVDAENTTGAVRLYERVGMHVVRRNDTWEKRL